jgi:hypothetical protein
VRTQLARGGIYDLKFFLDADRETVTHERSPLVYPAGMQNAITVCCGENWD